MKTTTPVSLRKVFTSAKTWTKHMLARRANGAGTQPDDTEAVQWCIIGGIGKVCGSIYADEADPLRKKLFKALPKAFRRGQSRTSHRRWDAIVAFNNDPNTTFGQIKTLIRKAGV